MAGEKFIAREFMEDFGLDYPEDLEKFHAVFFKFTAEGGSLDQLFKDLIEAFPEKKDRILNVPLFAEIDGEMNRATLPVEECHKGV